MKYPYKCPSCGIEYEVERSIHAESSSPSCSSCHVEMLRVFSAAPVIFNAGGFYSTDNK